MKKSVIRKGKAMSRVLQNPVVYLTVSVLFALAVLTTLVAGGSLPAFSPTVPPVELTKVSLAEPAGIPLPPPDPDARVLPTGIPLPPPDPDAVVRVVGIPLPPPDPDHGLRNLGIPLPPPDPDVVVRLAGIPLPPPDPDDHFRSLGIPLPPPDPDIRSV